MPAIIFEDNHIIVAIKPQNVACCPDESGDENLLDQMKSYLAEKGDKEKSFCGLVHRLDRVTGGVMVYAKTSKAAARLSEQIRENAFEKTYLAVVSNAPKAREATLVHYLWKNEVKNIVLVVPPATNDAKRAEMSYVISNKTPVQSPQQTLDDSPLNEMGELTLLEIRLVTGRSHQIRAQLCHIGSPIYGDVKYGSQIDEQDIALWAHKLSFKHPITEDTMSFIVNPPETAPWDKFDFDRQGHKHRGIE